MAKLTFRKGKNATDMKILAPKLAKMITIGWVTGHFPDERELDTKYKDWKLEYEVGKKKKVLFKNEIQDK